MVSFVYRLFLVSLLSAVSRVHSHLVLTFPPARILALDFLDNVRTPWPCGAKYDHSPITPVVAGENITITWELRYYHKGGYSFELLNSTNHIIKRLPAVGYRIISDPSIYEQNFTIPHGLECAHCTLRVVREAKEWTRADGSPYLFWSCANVDVLPPDRFKQKSCLNGRYDSYLDRCICDRLYSGENCQYHDDCEDDHDCYDNGKCHDTRSRSSPVRQCFCKPGWYGRFCEQSSILMKKITNYEKYIHTKLSAGFDLYHRVLKEKHEIEVVIRVSTLTWAAIGFRPSEKKLCGSGTGEPEGGKSEGDGHKSGKSEGGHSEGDEYKNGKSEGGHSEGDEYKNGKSEGGHSEGDEYKNGKSEGGHSEGDEYKNGKSEGGHSEGDEYKNGKSEGGHSEGDEYKNGKSEGGHSEGDEYKNGKSEGGHSEGDEYKNGKSEGGHSEGDEYKNGKSEGGHSEGDEYKNGKSEGGHSEGDEYKNGKSEGGHSEGDEYKNGKSEGGHSEGDEYKNGKSEGGHSEGDEYKNGKSEGGHSEGDEYKNGKSEGEVSGSTPEPGKSRRCYRNLHAMDNTDIVIGSAVGMYGRVGDYYTRDRSTPQRDEFYGGTASLTAGLAYEENGYTIVAFRRPLMASEQTDHSITDDDMHVIWARGQESHEYIRDELKYHGGPSSQAGRATINFLGAKATRPSATSGSWDVTVGRHKFKVMWWYRQLEETLDFRFTVDVGDSKLWVALGFSSTTAMEDSDVIVAYFNDGGNGVVSDRWNSAKVAPVADKSYDLTDTSVNLAGGIITVTFSRKVTTSDRRDFQFTTCPYVMHAVGGDYDGASGRISIHPTTPIVTRQPVCFIGNATKSTPTQKPRPTIAKQGAWEKFVGGHRFKVKWWYIPATNQIDFLYSVDRTTDKIWVALGFSDDKRMEDTDVVVTWLDVSGKAFVSDRWNKAKAAPIPDLSYDLFNTSVTFSDGITTVRFSRFATTADKQRDFQFTSTDCPYVTHAVGGGYDSWSGAIYKHPHVPVVSEDRVCFVLATASTEPDDVFWTTPIIATITTAAVLALFGILTLMYVASSACQQARESEVKCADDGSIKKF